MFVKAFLARTVQHPINVGALLVRVLVFASLQTFAFHTRASFLPLLWLNCHSQF
jgi:hypothetical protein